MKIWSYSGPYFSRIRTEYGHTPYSDTPVWPQACNFIKKETLVQVSSYEFCEISKNTFSWRTPLVAAFVQSLFQSVLTWVLAEMVIVWGSWVGGTNNIFRMKSYKKKKCFVDLEFFRNYLPILRMFKSPFQLWLDNMITIFFTKYWTLSTFSFQWFLYSVFWYVYFKSSEEQKIQN